MDGHFWNFFAESKCFSISTAGLQLDISLVNMGTSQAGVKMYYYVRSLVNTLVNTFFLTLTDFINRKIFMYCRKCFTYYVFCTSHTFTSTKAYLEAIYSHYTGNSSTLWKVHVFLWSSQNWYWKWTKLLNSIFSHVLL